MSKNQFKVGRNIIVRNTCRQSKFHDRIGNVYAVHNGEQSIYANFDGYTNADNGCFSLEDIELVDELSAVERRLIEGTREFKSSGAKFTASEIRTIINMVDRIAPNPTVEDPCNGKIVEIDGKKYKLTVVD